MVAKQALVPFVLVALTLPAAADILIVDPSGAGNYFNIQPAVDAAEDGDTILIKTGTYQEAVVVDGKGLTLQADVGADVLIQGGLRIINSLPGQVNVVADLRVEGAAPYLFGVDTAGLFVEDNQGPVTARNCELIGAPGNWTSTSGCSPVGSGDGFTGAALLDSSGEIALIDCLVLGGAGDGYTTNCYEVPGEDGGIGIHVRDSQVSLCGTTAAGGLGGPGGEYGGNGGDALFVAGPLAVVQSVNGTYTGADGGTAWDFLPVESGDGGDGLHADNGAFVQSFGDLHTGGARGLVVVNQFGCCAGVAGKPTKVTGGATLAMLGNYCVAGVSASGCSALIASTGTPSASAPSGFLLHTSGVEGAKDGQFYFGTNGIANNPWGNSSSTMCVAPPSKRGAFLTGNGTPGACDGAFAYDLNERWTQKPAQNPGAGAVVQAQFWYRDPFSTSNQVTCLSDAIEFPVCP